MHVKLLIDNVMRRVTYASYEHYLGPNRSLLGLILYSYYLSTDTLEFRSVTQARQIGNKGRYENRLYKCFIFYHSLATSY